MRKKRGTSAVVETNPHLPQRAYHWTPSSLGNGVNPRDTLYHLIFGESPLKKSRPVPFVGPPREQKGRIDESSRHHVGCLVAHVIANLVATAIFCPLSLFLLFIEWLRRLRLNGRRQYHHRPPPARLLSLLRWHDNHLDFVVSERPRFNNDVFLQKVLLLLPDHL
jgi:hypothetical protein